MAHVHNSIHDQFFCTLFKLIQQFNMATLSCLQKKKSNFELEEKSSIYYCKWRFVAWKLNLGVVDMFQLLLIWNSYIKLPGDIYSYGCALPNQGENIFQTRGPDEFCEWRNDAESGDAICFCDSNGCNSVEKLDRWIKHGDCGKIIEWLKKFLNPK